MSVSPIVVSLDREMFKHEGRSYAMHVASNLLKIYHAYRECYATEVDLSTTAIRYYENKYTRESVQQYIRKRLAASSHTSPLEHVSVSFRISNISRTCSHQQVRNRIASYSQRSQRYTGIAKVSIVPSTIASNPSAMAVYSRTCDAAASAYEELRLLGIPKEDARFLAPEATSTSLIMTMNFRELMTYFKVRCCNRAQWEIRDVANQILSYMKRDYACIFENAGPSCVVDGVCPEEQSCGRMSEVIDAHTNV